MYSIMVKIIGNGLGEIIQTSIIKRIPRKKDQDWKLSGFTTYKCVTTE